MGVSDWKSFFLDYPRANFKKKKKHKNKIDIQVSDSHLKLIVDMALFEEPTNVCEKLMDSSIPRRFACYYDLIIWLISTRWPRRDKRAGRFIKLAIKWG